MPQDNNGRLYVTIDGREHEPEVFKIEPEKGQYSMHRRGENAQGIGPIDDIESLVYVEQGEGDE